MIDNSKDIKKLGDKEKAEYYSFIKSSVKDGSYFKDSIEWYFIRYLSPLYQRTILIFAAILSAIILLYLSELIKGSFPLVEEFPVIIEAKDQSLYYPHLLSIKSKNDSEVATVDEAVAKYLVSVYIKDREEYDFSESKVGIINRKFDRLRNTSSPTEFRKFQLFMSQDNPKSPIYNFGKNVVKIIKVSSVKFIKEDTEDFVTKAKNFLKYKLPTEAEVRFTSTITAINDDGDIKETKSNLLVKVGFVFSGASKDKKDRSLNFMVHNYQLYKVQK